MYSSHIVNHVITALPNERTMCIPIIIDIGLLCLLKLPLEKLPKPIIANNVDGTTYAKGTIWWKAHTDILFKERMEKLKLMVLSLGCRQIILGMPWLKKWNPAIDWKSRTLVRH